MATVIIYKNGRRLGTGSMANGAFSVTSWTARDDGLASDVAHVVVRKNVQVAVTSSTHAGSSFYTRCTADNGSGTLTLMNAMPFAT
jgi:hypothetical protein